METRWEDKLRPSRVIHTPHAFSGVAHCSVEDHLGDTGDRRPQRERGQLLALHIKAAGDLGSAPLRGLVRSHRISVKGSRGAALSPGYSVPSTVSLALL